MIYKYNKLVRDKIPEEIENQGKECKYEILDDEKYSKELDKKLLEEVNEYISDHSEKEMADVQEVLKAIIKYRNIDEKRVEELRKHLGLNQEDFAKALKVSRQTVSSIETGKYNPSLELAFVISDFFGKQIEEIFIHERSCKDEKR